MIGDFYLCGLVVKEHAMFDTPANPWLKFCGKMHDPAPGQLSEFNCPVGPKRCFNCKQKIVQFLLLALRDRSNEMLKKKETHVPSCA